jgi:hypothetical protein
MGVVEVPTEKEELQSSYDLMTLIATLGEQDFYDRAKYEGNMPQEIVDVFYSVAPDPAQRTMMYTLWRSTAMTQGMDALADHEVLLLAYAPKDGAATEASKKLEQPFSYQWYEDNVASQGEAGSNSPWFRLNNLDDPSVADMDTEQVIRYMQFEEQARGINKPAELQGIGETLGRYAVNTYGAIAVTEVALLSLYGGLTVGGAVLSSPPVATTIATVSPWVKRLWAAGAASVNPVASGSSSAVGRAFLGTEPGSMQAVKDAFMYLQLRTGQPVAAMAQKLVPAASKIPLAGSAVAGSLSRVGTYGGSRGAWRLLAAGGVLTAEVVDSFANPEAVRKAQSDPTRTAGSDDEATRSDESVDEEAMNTSGVDAMVARTGLDKYQTIDENWDALTAEIGETVTLANVRTEEATQIAQLATFRTQTVDRLGRTRDGDEKQMVDAAPQVTDEDIMGVLDGTKSSGDIDLGGDPEMILAETAFSMFPGAHWYDPETDGTVTDVDAAGGVVYEDVRSLDEFGKVRKIVLPKTAVAGGAAEAYEYQYTKLKESMDNQPKDPFVGDLPEDYMARQFVRNDTRVDYGATRWETTSRSPIYRESSVYDAMAGLSPVQVFKMQSLARNAMLYQDDRPTVPGQISPQDKSIITKAMDIANKSTKEGQTWWGVLEDMADQGNRWRREDERAAGRNQTVRVKEPFTVPASLRSIPGEKTIAEEAKLRFERKLGRQATPEELRGIANELTGYHETSNQEQIALYLAAYNGDNQGLLTGAQMQRIEDPGAATSFDIADKWKDEIDLNKRRETNSESFSRMLSATMGNRPSVGNMTAAANVTQIGRQ